MKSDTARTTTHWVASTNTCTAPQFSVLPVSFVSEIEGAKVFSTVSLLNLVLTDLSGTAFSLYLPCCHARFRRINPAPSIVLFSTYQPTMSIRTSASKRSTSSEMEKPNRPCSGEWKNTIRSCFCDDIQSSSSSSPNHPNSPYHSFLSITT